MTHSIRDQAIALTAVLQAAAQVDRIATKNDADDASCKTIIHSLFQFEPESIDAVYGENPDFRAGKDAAELMFGGSGEGSRQTIMNYSAGMLRLAKQLQNDADMMSAVRTRLEHAERLVNNFSDSSSDHYSAIAGIYTDTISKLPFRITVNGKEQFLKNRANADKIRSLLFAGVRSAVLWRQCGGRRLHFIFKRNALINSIKQL